MVETDSSSSFMRQTEKGARTVMKFSYGQKREGRSWAQRSVVMATQGMAASSQPLATLSGYKILAKGGNAIDAAVAMVSTLSVVEPYNVGIGGDAFALIYLAEGKRLIGLNGSGRAPYGASLSAYREKGLREVPERGIDAVTVPGALHAWNEALERYGTRKLSEVLEDAIFYAEEGFPVSEVIAGEWQEVEGLLRSSPSASKTFLINGKAPQGGQRFRNEALAKTYRTLARHGVEAFYGGEIGEAILQTSKAHQGFLSRQDLLDHKTTWVEPLSTDYRGYTIYELPPNGQGLTALEMLNILEGYDIARLGHNTASYLHLLIEAKKRAFEDRNRFITDPEFERIPVEELLSKDYARRVRETIDRQRASSNPSPLALPRSSETVYVTAVDKDRNAVSFISSLFMHFGSGVVVEGTGIVLQNRGKSFSLNPTDSNRLEPHKRPMHTLIPGMVFKDGTFLMSFGVMGGDMQPQGHVQFLINLIDFGMNLQEALDAPRIRHLNDREVYLEEGVAEPVARGLAERGHQIRRRISPVNQVGGGQAIFWDREEDVLLGASDRRKDGCAIGY